MITIHTYGADSTLCDALSDKLNAAKLKFNLKQHPFEAIRTNNKPENNAIHIALIDLATTELTPQQLCDILNSQTFVLPSVVLYDQPLEEQACPTLSEPVIDILRSSPIQLVANSIVREARLQQYKRLVNQTRNQTRDEHQRLQTVLDHTEDGVVVIHNGKYVDINKAYLRIFEIDNGDASPGMPVREFLTELDNHEQSCAMSNTASTPNTSLDALQNNVLHSVHIQKRNGDSFITTLLKTACVIRGMPCYQIIIHNPNAWSDVDRNFLDLRSQDVDTGLLNRRYFLERLESMLKHREDNEQGALAFILVDNFREIRDDCGLHTGDSILQSIAQSLSDLAGENDTLCRFGDHSFTYYSCELTQQDFLERCDSMRQRIDEQLFGKHDAFIKLTISTGISFLNRHVLNVQQLISQADNACDTACSKGGNQIQVFKTVPTALGTLADTQAHIEAIQSALDQNRLHAMFQPIVHLAGDSVENYAVLLRMLDLDGSHILPDHFIQAAEQSGLICQLDLWVLQHCIRLITDGENSPKNRRFFLKLSIQSVKSPAFLDALLADLKSHNLNGSQLVFQVDYTEALAEHTAVKQFVKHLKKNSKCKFAFDHVGFGELTEQTLDQYVVDFIKIDGTFTRNLVNNPAYQNTIRQVLAAAKNRKIPVIAKSVEDANSLATLWNLGVDLVQGYFLQRPSDEMNFDFDTVTL